MPQENQNQELKTHTIVFMVVVALFFDALGALFTPIAMYWVVTIVAYLTFFVWFRLYGITFLKPKRLVTAGGSLIVELIPIINVLPAITLAVAIIALEAKAKKIVPTLDIIKK